jgi:hypothetical protein
MNLIKVLIFSCFISVLISCGSDDNIDVSDLPDKSWAIQLNGQDFSVPNTGLSAYYSSFSGDFTIAGIKSTATEERIVLTFSVANGAPFIDGQSLDLSEGSGNSILYFDGQGNNYSSLFMEGRGTFAVDKYIETDTRNFLSGNVNAVLFNKDDGAEATVTGTVAVLTF